MTKERFQIHKITKLVDGADILIGQEPSYMEAMAFARGYIKCDAWQGYVRVRVTDTKIDTRFYIDSPQFQEGYFNDEL